ncbi:endopeptidase SpoIID/LytB [bacterium LRH843]|nr:endopeptidase SpoIID/LytB [bacterium LRH843]
MKQMMLSSTFATGLFLTVPMIAEAALGDQALKEGMSHSDVKELQEVLKEKGHFTYHTATGYYGSITTEAVSAFQRARGLAQTGQASKETLDQLLNQSSGVTARATVTVMKPGVTSEQVVNLQHQLKQAGYFAQDVTGFYGRVTTEAVRSFQRDHKLAVDGIAGPQTLNTLQNLTAVTIEMAETKPVAGKPVEQKPQTNQLIRLGSSGQAVKELQEQLRNLGMFQGAADGQFNDATHHAVKQFQQEQRLSVDGIVGPKTWSSLAVAKPTGSTASPVQPPAQQPAVQTGSSLLRIGTQNEAVAAMQSQLKRIGLLNQESDGHFGTMTEQAIRAFQRQQGLTVDGIAGPATLERLNKLASGQSQPASEFNAIHVVADASELLGVPYVWGGISIDGFDCSGFLHYVYAKNGIQLPRTVAGIWDAGTDVGEPRVGDLVFFETYTSGPSHAGIYIGNNQFVHSGSSTGVTVASMDTAYWKDRYLGTKRVAG